MDFILKIHKIDYCKTSNIAFALSKHSSCSFSGIDREVIALPTEKDKY